MANRNKNYDEVLAKKFENPEYARNYLFHIVEEEHTSLDKALREVIKAMGLQKFSQKSNLSIQAISDFVHKRQEWSTDKTIKHIEEIFGLKVKLSLEVS